VGQLLEMSEQELLALKKLGRKSVEELQERIEGMGFSLRSKGDHET